MNTVKIGAVKLQLVQVGDTREATWPGRRHEQRMDQKLLKHARTQDLKVYFKAHLTARSRKRL